MSTIKDRLKEARLAANLTQEQLGVLAGLDENTANSRMNHYEKGRRRPDISVLKKIAEVLRLPAAYFYAESDDLALLIKEFHRMKGADRRRVLEFVESIE